MDIMKNQLYTARMTGYTAEGAGVCRIEGRAVFVPGALRDELWEVRIVKVASAAVWGRGETLLESSGQRLASDCVAFPRCGGCALRHMSYDEELAMKRQRVNDALQRIGGLDFSVDEILSAGEDARRRRKVIFNIGLVNGEPAAGFYRARSHDIVPVADCAAVPEEALRACRAVLGWMRAENVPAYDEANGVEGVRHVFVRSSRLTGRAVVTVIASFVPSEKKSAALMEALLAACPEMSGLVWNLNRSRGNTVLGGEFRTLWGDAALTESLCGLTFSLSPRSFFQVNPPQAEALYEKALEYADIRPDTLALDLYCGTGTIGLCMAKRGARIIGAEVVPEAVENAKENAARNGLSDRCEFICAHAVDTAKLLRERGTRPEVIVVDPPRKGLDCGVIESAAGMEPERIVYVSCDPGTLARDLGIFKELGYAPVRGTAVDMFPRTSHVETVVLMSKK